MNRLPRWRIFCALVVLGLLVFLLAFFSPYYFRNLELQNFVARVTQNGDAARLSDDVLRTWIVDKAHQLKLPVTEDNVHIVRAADRTQIDVRYFVRVSLPGYTVDLHFYPGAGSR